MIAQQVRMAPRSDPARNLFLAGGVAGGIEVCAVQPLDMVKTRLQLSPARSVGIAAGLREVVAEGGVRALYRGVVPELICGVPKSSAMYASFSVAKELIARLRGGRDNWLTSFCAGAVSGIPEALVMTPFQVVKVRLQSKLHLGMYANSLHCVRKLVATEGASSLLTGLSVTMVRNSVFNAVYFSVYSELSSRAHAQRRRPGLLIPATCGFASGVFASSFGAPFDVVKSRTQAGASGAPSTFAHLVLVARAEGVGALWKGFAAKSLRMGVGGAVGLGSFELVCDVTRPSPR